LSESLTGSIGFFSFLIDGWMNWNYEVDLPHIGKYQQGWSLFPSHSVRNRTFRGANFRSSGLTAPFAPTHR
jgi:hypothetical protein